MDEKNRNEFLDIVESKLEKISTSDVEDIDNFK
jgi:hypothetical protein